MEKSPDIKNCNTGYLKIFMSKIAIDKVNGKDII